jgi:hypothetical protein
MLGIAVVGRHRITGKQIFRRVIVACESPERETMPIVHDANDARLSGEELRPVVWQGRQWAVTTYGIESRDGLLRSRPGG